VALLTGPHDILWQRILDAVSRNKREREFLDRLRAEVVDRAGVRDWESVLAIAGEPVDRPTMAYQLRPGPDTAFNWLS